MILVVSLFVILLLLKGWECSGNNNRYLFISNLVINLHTLFAKSGINNIFI